MRSSFNRTIAIVVFLVGAGSFSLNLVQSTHWFNERWPGVYMYFLSPGGGFLIVLVGIYLIWQTRHVGSADPLRAYVSVASAIVNEIAEPPSLQAHVRIENTGQTLATEVTHFCGITIREAQFSRSKEDPWATETNTPLSKGPLGPGLAADKYVDRPPLSSEQQAAIQAGTLGIFVHGRILYRDALGKHQTKYRLMKGGGAPIRGGQLVFCEEGNEAN